MEGGKGGERFRPAHPGRDDDFAARQPKKVVKPVKAVRWSPPASPPSPGRTRRNRRCHRGERFRPAILGDRLTRREAEAESR